MAATASARMATQRTAGYVRVSTVDQTVASQSDQLRAWAAAQGVELELYADEGVSGIRDSRPALDRLLRDARLGLISSLVVAKLDRIGRSLRHLLAVVDELDVLGVRLIVLDLGADTRTPAGKLMLSVVGAMASFERELLLERTRAGIAAAKRRGVHCGRPTATSKEQRERIGRLVTHGHSVSAIAELVNLPRSTVGKIATAARRRAAGGGSE